VNRASFWLTVVSVNWGRGYDPGEFKANVMRVLKFTGGREHVVILPQELDEEPDPAKEHPQFARMLEPGSRRVHWHTREPIILSPGFKVTRRRKRQTMGSGQQIDGRLEGIGPERLAISCTAELEGVSLAFLNTHPHRNMPEHPEVQRARQHGVDVMADELARLRAFDGGTSGVWGADMNDSSIPQLVAGERLGNRRGLDHLRYWSHPDGAHLELKDRGSLKGTIDPHDPIWIRLLVTGR